MMTLMIIAILAIFGLIFGSFVNAWVWRLHEQQKLLERRTKPTKRQLARFSILKGRSMCPACKHELAPRDLVPVVSWLLLGGKCRYCGKPIGWQYPVVELLTAGSFVLSYLCWPKAVYGGHAGFYFMIWLLFLISFVALAVYDLRWYLLPNKIVYPLIVGAALTVIILAADTGNWWLLLQAGVAAISISGLFYVLFQASDGRWIGGGDVKLALALGLLVLTPAKAVLLLFLASSVGTIISLPLALRAKKGLKMQIPFGPFLLTAAVITVLFGQSLINWYSRLFILG